MLFEKVFKERLVTISLVLIIFALAALRLPTVWYRMGGQDEQWYTVPGWTVANEGVPRIPYVPTDDPGSVFKGADKLLFALPPAYFYVQAPFFCALPPGYGTARLATWASGIVCLLLMFYILRRLLNVRSAIALACLPICAVGRAFYFPWQDSRPDLLCAMFGLVAVALIVLSRSRASRRSRLTLVGICGFSIGLGALSHPYAIVFAIHVGSVILLCPGTSLAGASWRDKFIDCALAAATTLLGITLWLPLILLDTELFWTQFSTNVLSRSGPGLIARMMWPWPYVSEQTRLITERLGTFQILILVLATGAGLVLATRDLLLPRKSNVDSSKPFANSVMFALLLFVSGVYLHVACLGLHPAKGYLCYPWMLLVLLIGVSLERVAGTSPIADSPPTGTSVHRRRIILSYSLIVAIFVLLVPGSGIRATYAYAFRSGTANYNRQLFCQELSKQFPPGSRLLVSPEYVFEFELLGKKPVNASRLELYHDVRGFEFDYLIASTQAFDEGVPEHLQCAEAWEFGDSADPLACYVRVYVPTSQTPMTKPWPR